MSDYFNCNLCDKSVKIKSKKKHLKSRNHKNLSDSIISRYIIQNSDFLKKENTLKNYVLDYEKKLNLIQIYVYGNYTSMIFLLVLNLIHD